MSCLTRAQNKAASRRPRHDENELGMREQEPVALHGIVQTLGPETESKQAAGKSKSALP